MKTFLEILDKEMSNIRSHFNSFGAFVPNYRDNASKLEEGCGKL